MKHESGVQLSGEVVCGPEKDLCVVRLSVAGLLGAGVLGDSLCPLRHGVLGQLTGQQQADGGLDLPGGDGGALVVVSQTGGLTGDALKDVAHKRVHDAHGFGGDTSVGVDLFQDLVHVDGVALPPGLSSPLAAALSGALGGGFLRAFPCCFWCIRHFVVVCKNSNVN